MYLCINVLSLNFQDKNDSDDNSSDTYIANTIKEKAIILHNQLLSKKKPLNDREMKIMS